MKSNHITNESLVRYIEEHLKEYLSVQILANYFGYSEFHFSRLFKKQMGVPAMEYVCKRRLYVASEEILKGAKIIDVAFEFGWQSHSSFTKSFKREFGFSPSILKAMKIEIEDLGGSAMKNILMEQTNKNASKEELVEILKETIIRNGIEFDASLERVIQCATEVYLGIKRYSGDDYITHTLNVAIILAQLEADIYTIEAGLFCDAAKKSERFTMELLKEFSPKLQALVGEVSDAELSDMSRLSDYALLIKIAERLHNMRTVEFIDENKKKIKAKETVDIFMPIARRLGNEKVIAELNDLSIACL